MLTLGLVESFKAYPLVVVVLDFLLGITFSCPESTIKGASHLLYLVHQPLYTFILMP